MEDYQRIWEETEGQTSAQAQREVLVCECVRVCMRACVYARASERELAGA